jgi:hypothetical protein
LREAAERAATLAHHTNPALHAFRREQRSSPLHDVLAYTGGTHYLELDR